MARGEEVGVRVNEGRLNVGVLENDAPYLTSEFIGDQGQMTLGVRGPLQS